MYFTVDIDQDMALVGELDRVADKVRQNLANAPDIANEGRWQVGTIAYQQINAFARRRIRQQGRYILDALTQNKRSVVDLGLSSLDLRVIENVVDDLHQRVTTLLDRVDEVFSDALRVPTDRATRSCR